MYKRIRDARKNESGFTLIELLIVIVILGVLAGIVVFAVAGINDKGETSACDADVKTLEVAVEAYYAKEGVYPGTLTDLKTKGLLRSDSALKSGTTLGAGGVVTPGGACTP
jgi:general secretion pathway protein G